MIVPKSFSFSETVDPDDLGLIVVLGEVEVDPDFGVVDVSSLFLIVVVVVDVNVVVVVVVDVDVVVVVVDVVDVVVTNFCFKGFMIFRFPLLDFSLRSFM